MTGTTKKPRRSTAAPRKEAAGTRRVIKPASRTPIKAVAEEAAPEPVAEQAAAEIAITTEKTVEQVVEETIIPIESPVEAIVEAAEQVEQKGTEFMSDVIETTKKYTEEAKERFQNAFAEISEKAKSSVEKSTKAFEEFNSIAKGNVEALVESGKIASKGMETISQDAAEYGRVTFEKASAAMKSLAAVKSPTEFFQLQSELLSGAFDAFAKETAKNSEAILKLAGDVAQPLSTRVSVVTEKVRSIAA